MNDQTPEFTDTSADPSNDRGIEYARVKSMVRGTLFRRGATPLRIGRFSVLEQLGQGVFIGRVQPGVFDMRLDDVRFD